MVLNGLEVNVRREKAGKLGINSLWLWGEGALPETLAATHGAVFADDPLARGLAAVAGIPAHAPAGIAGPLQSQAACVLAVDDSLAGAWHRGDPDEWRAAALELDRGLFRAAWDALGDVESLAIHLTAADRTVASRLTPAARWRIWRSAKAIDRDA
jgi:hypothetical protein